MLNLTVEIVSNPDRDPYDWKETHVISARTIGYLSYNGRLWKDKYWEAK